MVDVPDSGDPIIRDMLRSRSVPEIAAPGKATPAAPQPAPEFAQEAKPAVVPEPDPIIEEMLGRRRVSRPEIDSVQRNADPDKFARAKKLGQEYDIPTEVAERNLDDLTRRQAADEAEFWLAQSGTTQEWLANSPDNLRIAHDSVKQLSALEQAVNILGRAPAGDALNFLGSIPSGAAEGIDALARATARPVQSALRAIGLPQVADALLAPITPEEIDPLKGLAALGATIKGAAKDVGVPEGERNLATDVTGGLAVVAAQITAMVLTGGAAGTTMLLASGADQAAERVQKAGVAGTAEGDTAVLAGGAITGLTERYGLNLLLNRIPQNVRSKVFQILAGASTEAVQEISENVLNNLTAIALYDPDGQILGDDTMYEGGVGAIVGGIVSAVIPGRQAIRARKDVEKLQKDIASTPLAQRDPGAAAEHFGAVAEASNLSIYVPAQRLAEELKPQQIVEFGFEDRIAEAMERGGDVKLTGEQFARLAIDGIGEKLLDDMRVGEGAMTAAEAKSVVDDAAAQRRGEEMMAQAERDAAAREAEKPAEQKTEGEEWKASAWQRRQLIAAGFGKEEIDGMSQQDVLDLVGEKPPSPTKWTNQADEPVELAEREMGFQAMFKTAAEAGMTEPQYASYLEALAVAQEGARKRAEERAIKRQQKTLTEEWKAERETVRQSVEESMRQRPVYAALDALGVDRLNADAIVEIMGQDDILEILPKSAGRQIFQRKGGIDPDILAEQYGFDTGREMLEAMFNAVPIKEAIDAETDRRMSEKHGAILDKQRDLQEALEDLHNDDQAKVLTFELAAMRRAKSKGELSPALFRQAAAMGLAKLQVNEINPRTFLDEEVRKGKLAGKLIRGKGKVNGEVLRGSNRDAAAQAKFQQILNFEYARQAFAAIKQIERQRKELARLTDPTEKIPGIDADFRDRILEIGLGYDFSKQREKGAGILTGDTHYTNMSFGAFNELYENVKALEKQGREERQLVVEGQKRDREAVVNEMIERADAQPDLPRVIREATGNEGMFDAARSTLSSLSTWVAKIELLLQRLDGGEVTGPWHKALFQLFADAQTAELDLVKTTMKPLVEGLPKSVIKSLGRREFIPSLGRNMTRAQLLMVALNSGNASNFEKMVEGSTKLSEESGVAQKWTPEGVNEALSRLRPDEAKWVQSVWDAFESIRPRVEETYRDIHGISPERIMPRPVKLGDVTVKGGYFPMIYDRRFQPAPQPGKQKAADILLNPMEKASVFSGMTKARVDDYSAPVSLDFTELAHALRAPIHFVTHYNAYRNVDKILSDRRINAALVRKLGPERRDEFRRSAEAIATNNADRHSSAGVNAFFQQVRSNITTAVLGLSWTTGISQLLGLATTVASLGQDGKGGFSSKEGVKWTLLGLDRYVANPAETVKHATALSGEMRHRLGNSDRDLSQSLSHLAGNDSALYRSSLAAVRALGPAASAFHVAQRASLKAIGAIQFYTVDVPTWTGAFNKALSQGMDEQAAVEYADNILRTSQASGHTKDLAAIQRQKGAMQLLTMFTTYTTLLYGLLSQTVGGMKLSSPEKTASGISRLVWLMAVPAVADAFLRQEGPPEDDEEGALAWWSIKTALYGIKSTPLVGQIAGSVGEGYRATLSPVENLLGTKIPQAIKSAMKMMQEDEELELKDARKIVDAVGLTIGVPGTVQLVRALKALENEDAEFYDYLVTPKKK